MAALASSELQTLGARRTRKSGLIKQIEDYTREAGELEDRRKPLHQLGNLLGRERYLTITVDRLRPLAFIWKEAADGVLNLNAPPAYEEPLMSPTTPAEAGI
ncbi:hypothetical protein Rt10032_c11g4489 [Rhodotorula toruloides]|uniref:Uncharacterized protein n=1 Tax=Rhodotorula toruloides TaxID=5286 RepID=A0A511KJB3_RHOTO|nr:hypothetical protein Rt10032_c11g4489 [Rhodotorula toruloides]